LINNSKLISKSTPLDHNAVLREEIKKEFLPTPASRDLRNRVVKSYVLFLSAVQQFDQMTRAIINKLAIINQLSILKGSYHIRDLLRSIHT
jgi:hypothetical protein